MQRPCSLRARHECTMGCTHHAGGHSAILEIGDTTAPRFSWAGFSSWVAWRSAYLTRIGTLKHRLYVATNWTLTLLFGRWALD